MTVEPSPQEVRPRNHRAARLRSRPPTLRSSHGRWTCSTRHDCGVSSPPRQTHAESRVRHRRQSRVSPPLHSDISVDSLCPSRISSAAGRHPARTPESPAYRMACQWCSLPSSPPAMHAVLRDLRPPVTPFDARLVPRPVKPCLSLAAPGLFLPFFELRHRGHPWALLFLSAIPGGSLS